MAGILKKIRFESVDATILSIEHVSRVLIRWKLKDTTQPLTNLKFFVYRGASPSEMEQLHAEGILPGGNDEFIDFTAELRDLTKNYYYQVRAKEFCGASGEEVQSFDSEVFTFEGDLDFVGIYVVEEHIFAHRWVYGVPTFIYKKRKEGARCPTCWDDVLQRVTMSNCQACYGTGRLEGFYPPIEAWMGMEPDPKLAQVAQWGEIQPNQTDIQFTNYPTLNVDDVILELKSNKLWKVTRVHRPEKNRVAMLQAARLDAINRTDIEYKLDVPQERKAELLKLLEERKEIREF